MCGELPPLAALTTRKNRGIHSIEGWPVPRADMEAVEDTNLFVDVCNLNFESSFLGLLAWSLYNCNYEMSYPRYVDPII